MNQLAKAIAIAAQAFKNKTDKAGQPYILHCLHVMYAQDQKDHKQMAIAVLHDLLEDCKDEWNVKRLYEEGFDDEIIGCLLILSHDKEKMSYDDYIKAIATNERCVKVKLADLEHNSSITRLKDIGKKDFDRMEKYHRSYLYLRRI